jgi:hypothetical protein
MLKRCAAFFSQRNFLRRGFPTDDLSSWCSPDSDSHAEILRDLETVIPGFLVRHGGGGVIRMDALVSSASRVNCSRNIEYSPSSILDARASRIASASGRDSNVQPKLMCGAVCASSRKPSAAIGISMSCLCSITPPERKDIDVQSYRIVTRSTQSYAAKQFSL